MKGLEANRISDEMLENVSGGTNSEMMELQDNLGVSNLAGIKVGLENKGIEVKVSSRNKNEYRDKDTKEKLEHGQVMNILKKKW